MHNTHNILHSKAPSSSAAAAAAGAAAAARGQRHLYNQDPGFWSPEASLSPDRTNRQQSGARGTAAARASARSHQARDGGGQRHHQPQSHHSGPTSTSYVPRGSGRLSSSGGGERDVSPGRHMRHSYDGFNHLAAGVRRQQQQQQHGGAAAAAASAGSRNSGSGLGGSGGAVRGSSAVGDGGVVDAHDLEALLDYRMAALRDSARRQQRSSTTAPMDPLRRSGPLSGGGRGAGTGTWTTGTVGAGVVKGDASVEYAAVRREIELEREAMSRRTQEQLRELEGGDSSGREGEAEERQHRDDDEEDDEEDDERYTSFGSGSNEDQDDQQDSPRRYRRSEETASAENEDEMGGGVGNAPSTPLSLSQVAGRGYLQGGAEEGGREESIHLAESLALELQESVVPLAAAGRRFKGAAPRLPEDEHQTAPAAAAETPDERTTRTWLEQADSNSIPDDVVAVSSSAPSEAEAVSDAPEMGGDSASEGGGSFGAEQRNRQQEEVDDLSEVQEEVASTGGFEEVVEEVPGDLDVSVAGRNGRRSGDDNDGDEDEGDYGSVSFETDDNEAADEHAAAAASEVESETSDGAPGASAAAQYSQDFEASSPTASGAETTAVSARLPLTPSDGSSEGLRSPPALYQDLGRDVVSGSGGERRSGSASGSRQPGSSGSLASMEATVAHRRDKVQQMRRKLEGLQESRGRVRAKRALAQQLEALEVGMTFADYQWRRCIGIFSFYMLVWLRTYPRSNGFPASPPSRPAIASFRMSTMLICGSLLSCHRCIAY